jgi:hypothetical protein
VLANLSEGICSTPTAPAKDFEFVDGQYCVGGLPAFYTIPIIDGVRQPPEWSRLGGAVFTPSLAQIAGATEGECPFVLTGGGVSIANGTNAVNLGPDGTQWPNGTTGVIPVGAKLKSMTVCVRKGADNNAAGTGPGAVNDRVQIVGTFGSLYLLEGECDTWQVSEDQDSLSPLNVYTLGNAAAKVTYTYGSI